MHQVVVDSINRVDLDLRKSLFSNIVLSGGSTLCRGASYSFACVIRRSQSIAGFGDRLLNEVKKLALKDVKIKIYAPPERKYSTWIGGSILAGLNTFKKVWCCRVRICYELTPGTDVGFGGGISGGSGHHSQETGFLSALCFPRPSRWFVGRTYPSHSYDTRHVVRIPNAILQAIITHAVTRRRSWG